MLIPLAVCLLFVLVACSDSGGNPGPNPGPPADTTSYLTGLPGWEAFSPPLDTQQPAPTGEPSVADPVTLSAPVKDEDGNVERDEDTGEPLDFQNVTYTCTETPYSLTETPEDIVMYNPDASILWPGSLIQGRSYAGGTGSLLGLTIAERAPIQIAITDFFNDNPAQVVADPSLVTVTQALGDMVGDAAAQNLDTPSTIQFNIETYRSERDFAASFDISGRYLNFSGSASGDLSQSASETTVAVHFYQQMFTVSVAPPQTPGSFFSAAFTEAKLQEQIDLGRIGPTNLPVYISEVVYGRMMMFTMTSMASEDEIRGTINAAYNGISGGASASLSASQREVLQSSKIAITSYGGPADATIAMIRSGDWSQYFTESAALTTARPLSYVFRNLGDGSIAKVSEAGQYTIRECAAKVVTPGTFDFSLVQKTEDVPLSTPYTPYTGDFNGDGQADLLLNHKATDNEMLLAFGTGAGSFDIVDPVTGEPRYVATHPERASEGWGNFETRVMDVNGDGCDDVVWNVHITGSNKTYAALSQQSGGCGGTFTGFDFAPVSEHANSDGSGWELYDPLVTDVNGDGNDDLVWNITVSGLANRTYVGLSNGDGSFESLSPQDHPNNGWGNFDVFTANVNGDLYGDLLWESGNRIYTALGSADGTFDFRGFRDYSQPQYDLVVGNINGDVFSDLIDIGLRFNRSDVAVGYGEANDSNYNFNTSRSSLSQSEVYGLYENYLADVNGDGRDDLVWTGGADTPVNLNIKRIYVGLGTDNTLGPIDFTRVGQDHPQILNWDNYDTVMGDVDGDGLDDIIWVRPEGTTNRIFVGLAKNEDQ
ncbi:MAG: thiol-activated cytolysin family protein [Trueperaceae bacterium]|nr:thiol-activated cytolysin family protein [Trueperaceae bacterium]